MKQKKPSSLTRILGYAGGHKNLTILGCILSALSAVLGLAPYLCVWLVARSILAAWPSLDGAGDLGRFGWMAVWFAIGSILLYFAALMSTHIAAFRTARNIRRAAMTHVLKLPLGFFTGNQSGRLRKLIDHNAGLTEDLLAHKLPDLAATAVTPIAAIVVLFLFDWRMGLLCLLTMVLALLSMCLMMGGKNAGFFHRYQKEIERMSGEAVEYVRGIPVVKIVPADGLLLQGLLRRHPGLQQPGQPVRHELPNRPDLLPHLYQRGLCAADPGGAADRLRRRCAHGAGEFYLLRPVRPRLRPDDQPHHVYERGGDGGR